MTRFRVDQPPLFPGDLNDRGVYSPQRALGIFFALALQEASLLPEWRFPLLGDQCRIVVGNLAHFSLAVVLDPGAMPGTDQLTNPL